MVNIMFLVILFSNHYFLFLQILKLGLYFFRGGKFFILILIFLKKIYK